MSLADRKNPIKNMRRVDLTGKERQLRASVAAMTRIAAEFVRGCRRSIPFLVRFKCHFVPGSVEIVTTAADFAGPPTDQSYCAHLLSLDGRAWGAVRLDAGAISFILEGSLGGRGAFWGLPDQPRFDLSSAQKALLARMVGSIVADLRAAFEKAASLRLEPVDQIGDKLPEAGEVLRVSCSIEGLPIPANLIIAASAQALESAAKEQNAEAETPVNGDPRVADVLQDVALDLHAELGRTTLGLKRVLSLQPGDIIRLPTATDDPLTIRIAGLTKFLGVPIISRGQNAIEIRSRNEE